MWWNSRTVLWNSGLVIVEQGWWNSEIDSGTVWWSTARVMVEKCGGTLAQCAGTEKQ